MKKLENRFFSPSINAKTSKEIALNLFRRKANIHFPFSDFSLCDWRLCRIWLYIQNDECHYHFKGMKSIKDISHSVMAYLKHQFDDLISSMRQLKVKRNTSQAFQLKFSTVWTKIELWMWLEYFWLTLCRRIYSLNEHFLIQMASLMSLNFIICVNAWIMPRADFHILWNEDPTTTMM